MKITVQELKRNWVDDPVWDLATTEGFETYAEDLIDFETRMNKIWQTQGIQRTFRDQVKELRKQLEIAEESLSSMQEYEALLHAELKKKHGV